MSGCVVTEYLVLMQKHPWFRQGLPQNLEVDTYNGHYVKLSKQAADNTGDNKDTYFVILASWSSACLFTSFEATAPPLDCH